MMASNFTGITIRGDRIKVVEVESTRQETTIKEILTTTIERFDSASGNIITALPGKGTTFRILTFPFKQKKKILQVLPSELEDSIPFGLDEVVYDFQVWDRDKRSTTVLVTIVKKEEYEQFASELKKIGLKPVKIGVEPLYLSTLFSYTEEDENIGILDIEENHSNLLLWGGKQRFFPRYLSAGSEQLTKLLMEKHNITSEEAENLRQTGEIDDDTMDTYVRLLSAELTQTLFSYRNQTGEEIKKLYITGYGNDKQILTTLHKATGVPCVPLHIPTFPPLPPSLSQNHFHLPLALALNGTRNSLSNETNFALPAEESEKEWEEIKPTIITAAVLYVIFLLILLAGVIFDYTLTKREYQKIKGEELKIVSETIPEEAAYGDYVNSLKRKVEELKKRLNTSTNSSSFSILDILKGISENLPQDTTVTITDLTIDGKNLRMKGETSDFTSLDKIRQALASVKQLQNVSVVDSKKLQKKGTISFTIVAKIGESNGTNGP